MKIHIWLSSRHINAYLKVCKFKLSKNFLFNLFMGKWCCLTIRHKHYRWCISALLGYLVLGTPSYVWGILLPNRAKPTFYYKSWKSQTLAFPAIFHEVLAPGQSSTNQMFPLKNLIWKLVLKKQWTEILVGGSNNSFQMQQFYQQPPGAVVSPGAHCTVLHTWWQQWWLSFPSPAL